MFGFLIDQQLGCRPGWYFSENNCFFTAPYKKTFGDAGPECAKLGYKARLAEIRDTASLTGVTESIKAANLRRFPPLLYHLTCIGPTLLKMSALLSKGATYVGSKARLKPCITDSFLNESPYNREIQILRSKNKNFKDFQKSGNT